MVADDNQGEPKPSADGGGISSSGPGASRTNERLLLAAIGIATLVAYAPSLGGRLLWDDDRYMTRASLQSLHGLWRIWSEPGASEQYYPLLHSVFWIQHRLWGDNPLGYHCFTLLMHVAATGLFCVVLRRLTVPGAPLAAMLFALHPVHAESVAWITEQKNTLSLVCFLASAFVYVGFDRTRRPSQYVAALTWFVLSLLCKTVTATLPAALLVALWWRRGSLDWKRDVRPLVPWLALGAAAGVFSSWIERRFLGAEGGAFNQLFPDRILVAGRAIWFYLGHVAWPAGLNFIYPRWKTDPGSAWQWVFPVSAVVLAGALWSIRGRTRAPLAAYLIFVGTLFPVLGFVNLYGALYSFVWDHWQYMSDLAPIALAASALALGWGRLPARWQWAGLPLSAVLGLVLATLTWIHSGVFHDKETLYKATLARNPSCWMAENNLAIYLKESGRLPEAIGHYEMALRMAPERPDMIHNNLGIALAESGRLPEAIVHYEAALSLRSGNDDAESNLGIALAKSGRPADAIPHFESALRLKPERMDVRSYLARALVTSGRVPEAIRAYEDGLKFSPEHPEVVRYNIGLALSESGHLPEAIEQFEQAVRLKPDFAEAQNDLGITLANSGRIADAVASFRVVSRLRPDVAEAHLNLAEALQAAGNGDEAAAEYQKAVRLDPTLAPANR